MLIRKSDMPDCAATEWAVIVERFGIPLILLGLVLWAIIGVFKWLAPRADKWLVEYVQIQERKTASLEVSITACMDLQKGNMDKLVHLGKALEDSANATEHLTAKIDGVMSVMRANRNV